MINKQDKTPSDHSAAEGNHRHHEDEGLGSIRARRNLLTGYWAGSLIGLNGEELGRYASDLHLVDHTERGDSDVIARLSQDLEAAGHPMSKTDIAAALRRFHVQALKDTGCTE
ncbi:MAG: ATPase inhibitor subunit zeta [Rhizobium sp.]|nr:ATPase inhibitor subunit zeta [Rhizobium sp.]